MQNNMEKIRKFFGRLLFSITPRFYFCPDVTMIRWLDFEFLLPNKNKR